MPSIAVVSSIYGDHDQPAIPPAQDVDCEWVMVTDQPEVPPPWRVVYEPRELYPRLAAKVAKCRPDMYTDADILIWIDGNVVIDTPDFVSWCVSQLDGGGQLAQHHSTNRTSLILEAQVAAGMPKYFTVPVVRQAESYVADGYPDDWGVWWTGLMVRTSDCPDFGTPWLAEMVRWTPEDQVSQPPTLHAMGLRPTNIDIEWPSDRFHLIAHRTQW